MRQDSEWISISDMMAGLMMIFLLITVSYMLISEHNQEALRKSNEELRTISDKMSAIAEGYYDIEFALYHDLIKEFGDDLKMWNAEIDSGNTIRFKEPDVLFATGEGAIQQRFK